MYSSRGPDRSLLNTDGDEKMLFGSSGSASRSKPDLSFSGYPPEMSENVRLVALVVGLNTLVNGEGMGESIAVVLFGLSKEIDDSEGVVLVKCL